MDSFVECLHEAVLVSRLPQMEQWSELNKQLAYKYASYEHSANIIVKDLNLLINRKK
jgi:hypothetical protein